jgi:regulator of sigma E protease
MLLLVSAIAFVVLLTGLVLIHEWGHYITAKLSGVTVEEFGFGLPPRAKKLFTRKGTVFSLNWIPFGGFVRLKGEDETTRTQPGSFGAAPLWRRAVILLAGVGMNFVLAVLLFTIGFSWGKWVPTYLTLTDMQSAAARGEIRLDLGVMVSRTLPDGAAAAAGVPARSLITAVDDQPVHLPEDVTRLQAGKERVRYALLTGSGLTHVSTVIVPVKDGKTGVELLVTPRVLDAPMRSLGEGFVLALRETKVVTQQTMVGLGDLVRSLVSEVRVPEGVTGIIGIAELTYSSVKQGFMVYLRLVALLSLSLAVLNVLPFPALDGGRLALVVLEAGLSTRLVQRVPILRRALQSFVAFEQLANAVGFILLLIVILFVSVYDVIRLVA